MTTVAIITTYKLTASERTTVLLQYFRGFDPSTTHRFLWPAGGGPSYQEFVRLYVDEIIAYHSPAAEERRSALDDDGKTAVVQLRRVRDLMLQAIEECCREPIVELAEGKFADRMPTMASLAKAHSTVIGSISKFRRQQLEEAAALHSLLTSNADRDGGDD